MARNDVVHLLSQIQLVISSIYDLMQRGEDTRRSQVGGVPGSAPGRPQQWRDPASLAGMGGGQGRAAQSALGAAILGPYGMLSALSQRFGGGVGGVGGGVGNTGGAGGSARSDVFGKLVEVLNKLDQKLGAGGGLVGGSAGGGTQPTKPRFSSVKDEWEFDRAQKRAQDYLERTRQKYFADKERDQEGWGGTAWRWMGNTGRFGMQFGRGAVNLMGGIGSVVGSTLAGGASTDASGSRMEGALAGLGRSLGRTGPVGSAIGGVLGIPAFIKNFTEEVSKSNLRLADYSPSMAQVQAYAEVEKIGYDARLGEMTAGAAGVLERTKAENRRRMLESNATWSKAWSGIAGAADTWWTDTRKDAEEGGWKNPFTFIGRYMKRSFTAGRKEGNRQVEAGVWPDADNPLDTNKMDIQDAEGNWLFSKKTPLGGATYLHQIGSAWWTETYGRPPHWEEK